MEVGLLWFDDNKDKSLKTKVNEAMAAYCAKPRFAGKTPNTCYVHPSVLPENQEVCLTGVRVVATATVAPNHFLVGEEDVGDNGRDRPKRKRKRSRSPKS